MGRQAHVIRQLLGRSPFGDPLRDEDGNFVLGPHAHDNDAPGYQQQFDDRGHPRNRQSSSSAAALRRAQNDVLATVGVVVRKGEERKSIWERMDDREKQQLVDKENNQGRHMGTRDRLLGFSLPWTFTALRARLMTYESYTAVPLVELMMREYRVLGPLHSTLAGYSLQVIGYIPRLLLYSITNPDSPQISRREKYSRRLMIASASLLRSNLFLQLIEIPILVHSTLRILSIVPQFSWPYWISFIPFSSWSIINFPKPPTALDASTVSATILSFLTSPLVLYLLRSYLHDQLYMRIHLFLRQLFTKPDRPDMVSVKSFHEIGGLTMSGIGWPCSGDPEQYEKCKRSFGPKSVMGSLRDAFPWLYKILNFFSGGRIGKSRGRLTPLLERQLRTRIRERYWEEGVKPEDAPVRGSSRDIFLRMTIANSVFDGVNLNLDEELVDPAAWINDILESDADSSHQSDRARRMLARSQEQGQVQQRQTDAANHVIARAFQATPNSDAVVIHANDGQIVMATQRTPHDPLNVAEMNNIHTIHASEVPLDVLIRALNSAETEPGQAPPHQEQHRAEPQADQGAIAAAADLPSTPVPGISRAPSLTDPQIQNASSSASNPRPVRRPTETDDSIAAISQTLRAEAENLQSPRPLDEPAEPTTDQRLQTLHQTIENEPSTPQPPDPPLTPLKHRQYRVTMLSNFPADSLAQHASNLLTALILWPIDAMWFRSVAIWALTSSGVKRTIDPDQAVRFGHGIIGRPLVVLGLDVYFGGALDTTGKLQYVSRILLTLGLEGLVRGVCWSYGVWRVKRRRDDYGWSQF